MKMTPTVPLWFLAAFLLLLGSGCNWFGDSSSGSMGQAFDTPAQVLASEAEARFNDGEFDEAAELFQQLKDRHPGSKFALFADLRVGDAYFKAKRYEEAALAYDDFIRLHPRNNAVPYALYQQGLVYHAQMLTPDRDPSNARKARRSFERLLQRFPRNEWAVKAAPKLKDAIGRMASHEMFVGDFYFRLKKYRAALGRYKKVLTKYPDTGLYGEALAKIRRAEAAYADLPDEERNQRLEVRTDLDRRLPQEAGQEPSVLDRTTMEPPIGGVGGGDGL